MKNRFEGYYIKGSIMFDTQVIVTSRIDPKTHRSLRVLTAKARREDVEAFIENAGRLTDPGDKNNIEAVLQVSIAANQELYDEIRRNSIMCDALRQLLNEEIEEEKRNAVQNERQRAEQETLLETIKKLMTNLKMTADQAMSAIDIPIEKRAEYRAKL